MGAFESEIELVCGLKHRDAAAFDTLIAQHQTRIYNLLYRMTGVREEAEDLAQEVFVSVYRKIEQFRSDAPLATWIYRIAYNTCVNRKKYMRRRRDRDQQPFDELAERGTAGSAPVGPSAHIARPDEEAEGNEMERLVQIALSELDEEQRAILVLRDVQNVSYEDIGAITGLPAGTVKSRLHRARMALKERLAPHLR